MAPFSVCTRATINGCHVDCEPASKDSFCLLIYLVKHHGKVRVFNSGPSSLHDSHFEKFLCRQWLYL